MCLLRVIKKVVCIYTLYMYAIYVVLLDLEIKDDYKSGFVKQGLLYNI